MRKLIPIFLVLTSLSLMVFGQGKYQIDLKQENIPFKLKAAENISIVVESEFSKIDFTDKHLKEGVFTQVSIEGTYHSNRVGYPQLPQVKRLIEIPYGAKVKINLIEYDRKEYSLKDYGIVNEIIPAQRSVSKSEDPSKVKFEYNKNAYSKKGYKGPSTVEVQKIGQMRGVNLGRLVISPVQYDPVNKSIRVYRKLVFRVEFEKSNFSKTARLKEDAYSPVFEVNYRNVVNYKPSVTKDQITKYPIKYVIVSDRMFETTLAPFVEWKTKKGFKVVTAYTDVIGTSTTQIKNYLKNLYDSGTSSDPAPTYVLFVGDVAQIPSFSSGEHVTDLRYCEYTGDDLPEVYYGRFSASSVAQLQPQIDKTIEYEQYTMSDPSFLEDVVLVAGADANYAATHGNGQINYATSNYFNSNHNINAKTYLYPASQSSAQAIRNDISSGCGFANYTAHCSPSGWADPEFSISHISSLQNAHKYPFMIGNCCRSSRFNENCFAEEILRVANKGAIGYVGGSDYTYWDEDFYFGVGVGQITANPTYSGTSLGAYDCAFHENGESVDKWFITNGQVLHAGNLAVTENGSSTTYYWEIYHLMGDPSVMTYFSIPGALTANYSSSVPSGTTSLNVTTEQYAYVAISKNGALLDAKYSGTGSSVQLSFDAIQNGTADIVITKQNKIPHIGTVSVSGSSNLPVAAFSGSPTSVNVGGTVSFTDNSSNNPTSWLWTFEGGTPATSTEQNPTVIYNNIGSYSVTLKVTNSEGFDTHTKTGYINVQDKTYCNSKGNDFSYEWIAKVQIGSFENSSDAAGYTDFTSKTVTVNTGSISVTLTPGFSSSAYNEYWKIWVDLNKDGDFGDANELVFDPGSMSQSAVTGNMSIPASASGTKTRMRVSMKYNAAQTSCEEFSYGEVEDYTISITGGGDTEPPSAPANLASSNVTINSVSLNWTASTDNVGVAGYDVYKDNALLTNVSVTNYNVTGLSANTTYEFYVKAKDAAGNESSASNTISVTTEGGTITYCSSQGNDYSYEWIAGVQIGDFSNSSNAAGYTDFTGKVANLSIGSHNVSLTPGFGSSSYTENWVIWIDFNKNGSFTDSGEQVFSGSGSSTVSGSLSIPSSESGTTRMRVSMKYNGTPTSCEEFSYGEVEDYTLTIPKLKSFDSVAENNKSKSFIIYPNPAGDILNIELLGFDNKIKAKIIDVSGHIIIESVIETELSIINIKDLLPGVYLLKLEDKNQTESKSFIKK